MMHIKCCYKCVDRTSSCHTYCNRYKEEKELVDTEKRLIDTNKARVRDYLSVKYKGNKHK